MILKENIMSIHLGIVGAGSFAQCFIPLFKAHPLVREITLCDLDAAKLKENSAQHGIRNTCASLDRLLETDVDAVALFTQNWLHGPQAVKALRAGKHVYSAVPAGVTVEEIRELVKAAEETGNIYMMGETSYYYPGVVYCRDKFQRGEFGHVVYGEAEYYHDWDHGLYDVMKWRGGERWIETAGSPPMHYPTHSTSMIVSVTGAWMTHVSCHGFVDKKDAHLYGPGTNQWGNPFSNQTALFSMSDGSCCRINEFRRVGHVGTERMSLFGTEACFEHNIPGMAWVKKNSCEDVKALLTCGENGYAPVHQTERLPREFASLRNGHCGTHHFLVDDFAKACVSGKQPPVHVWAAARYTLPGIVAHESAMQGGALFEIPDLGSP